MRSRAAPQAGERSPRAGDTLTGAGIRVSRTDEPAEREAERLAARALSAGDVSWSAPVGPPPSHGSIPKPGPLLGRTGTPLARSVRDDFEPRFGADLSRVRVHADRETGRRARSLNARAFAYGHDVYFAPEHFRPTSVAGRRLLAHELAHTVQQSRGLAPYIARSVDDWFTGSLHIGAFSYTELLNEIDELEQWLGQQIASSAETVRIEEALTLLREEAARREERTREAARAQRGRRRRRGRSQRRERRESQASGATAETLRRPRILVEQTSIVYEDPVQMRAEYDLIMEWLAREEVPPEERRILEAERDALAPQFDAERARVRRERRAERLRTALTPAEEGAAAGLVHLAGAIEQIEQDPRNPALHYLYHEGERIPISADQAERLRRDLLTQLQRTHQSIGSRVTYYWDRYEAQVEINEDTFLIDDIAALLGGVEDPGEELGRRVRRARGDLRRIEAAARAGDLVTAASALAPVERNSQVIRALSRAFYEGHIEGAQAAVTGLEFTRDASFAIAGSIAAVVAAPVVAGAAAGAGLTGVSAGVATTAGTGLVVGTGTAVVRGGSAVTGHLIAGSSPAQVREALVSESMRGFREGFVAGAAGGAARVLGPALGVGTQVSAQVARRAAAEAIVGGTSEMVSVLMNGGSVEQAVGAGLRAAALSIPGSLAGSAGNRIVREIGGPLTAGATAYAGAIASGASTDEAVRAAGLAVTTDLAMGRAAHGSDADAALAARGRSIGERVTARGRRPAPAPETAPPSAPPPHNELDLAPGEGAQLELDYDAPPGGTAPPHREIDLEPDVAEGPPLELDTSPVPTSRPVPHRELDLPPVPEDAPPLRLYRGAKPVSEMPGARPRRPEFGAPPSSEVTGTHLRTGMQYNELNPAELSGVRLRTDPVSGEIQRVRFEVRAEATTATRQTDRSFSRDRSTHAPQSRDSAYTNSGYDRGHLVQREALRGDADVERAADQFSMVVPMTPELNRGSGSLWRASEDRAMQWAAQYGDQGPVTVEVEPVYGPNPERLPDGTPIPHAIRRRIIAPDGTVLEDMSHLNR